MNENMANANLVSNFKFNANNINADFGNQILNRWLSYRNIYSDPSSTPNQRANALMKANFIIGFFAFKLEFGGENFNTTIVQTNAIFENNNASWNSPKTEMTQAEAQALENLKMNPAKHGTNQYTPAGMATSIILPIGSLHNKMYEDLEQRFIAKLGRLYNNLGVNRSLPIREQVKQVFAKSSGFKNKGGEFMKLFHFHASGMFGWFSYIGYFPKKDPSGKIIGGQKSRYTGSCNVYSLLALYSLIKMGLEDFVVYTPHGMRAVKSAPNPLTAQMVILPEQMLHAGSNSQFCHHGLRLKPSRNAKNSAQMGLHGGYNIVNIKNKLDTFDILTLTVIYRLYFRIQRTSTKNKNKKNNILIGFLTRLEPILSKPVYNLIRTHSFVDSGLATKSYRANNASLSGKSSLERAFNPLFSVANEGKRNLNLPGIVSKQVNGNNVVATVENVKNAINYLSRFTGNNYTALNIKSQKGHIKLNKNLKVVSVNYT